VTATGQLVCYEYYLGAANLLHVSSDVFSDGVEAEVDVIHNGASYKLFIDKILKVDATLDDPTTTTGGLSENNLDTNDIVITTHPYPALGIATSRVVCPQTTNTYTHAANFVAEIKNVTLPAADDLSFQFRISGSDELTLNIHHDGSLAFLDNATSRITAAGGTVSSTDDIVFVCDGANGQIFVDGVSAGTTTAIAHLTGTAGKRLDATTGVCDHIALFPRDVSGLLPKGTF